MGEIRSPQYVKFMAGLLLPGAEDLGPARRELESLFGPIDLAAPLVPFDFTKYYTQEMGQLLRTYVAFSQPLSPVELVRFKSICNEMEDRWRREDGTRRINVDPGYISLSQLVLASTKPFSHRIYLEQGIWAEVTLRFREGTYEALPWTYPDYQAHIPMFNEWRNHFKAQMRFTRRLHPDVSIQHPGSMGFRW